MEKELTIKQRTQKIKKEILDGLGGVEVKFIECEHVKKYELPARVNIYLSKDTRLLLCKVCANQAKVVIDRFMESEDYFSRERSLILSTFEKKLQSLADDIESIEIKNNKATKWWQFWRK